MSRPTLTFANMPTIIKSQVWYDFDEVSKILEVPRIRVELLACAFQAIKYTVHDDIPLIKKVHLDKYIKEQKRKKEAREIKLRW